MAKEGSTISGFADAFAQAISYALQYGVPLQALVDKFSHARFEPRGLTKTPDVRVAKSIVDYVFRWLATKFLSSEAQFHAGVNLPPPGETNGHDAGQQLKLRDAAEQMLGPAGGRGDGGGPVRDTERSGAAAVRDLRRHHDPQRGLLQVRQLRSDQRLRVGCAVQGSRPRPNRVGSSLPTLVFPADSQPNQARATRAAENTARNAWATATGRRRCAGRCAG